MWTCERKEGREQEARGQPAVPAGLSVTKEAFKKYRCQAVPQGCWFNHCEYTVQPGLRTTESESG